VLRFRFELLEQNGIKPSEMNEKIKKITDPFDLYSSTLNIIAYRNGKVGGILRVVEYIDHNPLLNSQFDFTAAYHALPEPIFYMDWLGTSDDVNPRVKLPMRMIHFAALTMSRQKIDTVIGLFPKSLLSELTESFFAKTLSEKTIISEDGSELVPLSLSISSWSQQWTKKIKDREILRFQDLFYKTIFEPGEILFAQGERGSTAYLIEEGEVEAIIESEKGLIPIATLSENQLIGEVAMITQESRTASVVAKNFVSCLAFDRYAFLSALDLEPHLSMEIFKIFSKRLNEANKRSVKQ